MRKLIFTFGLAAITLTAAGVTSLAVSTPAAAQDYAYCLQSQDTGIPGDCSYSSYGQCMVSASGRGATCSINPRVAFGAVPRYRRGYASPY
jgi:hypothetical protein